MLIVYLKYWSTMKPRHVSAGSLEKAARANGGEMVKAKRLRGFIRTCEKILKNVKSTGTLIRTRSDDGSHQ